MSKTAWYAIGALAALYVLTKPKAASAAGPMPLTWTPTSQTYPNGVPVPPPAPTPVELAANPEARSGRGHF